MANILRRSAPFARYGFATPRFSGKENLVPPCMRLIIADRDNVSLKGAVIEKLEYFLLAHHGG